MVKCSVCGAETHVGLARLVATVLTDEWRCLEHICSDKPTAERPVADKPYAIVDFEGEFMGQATSVAAAKVRIKAWLGAFPVPLYIVDAATGDRHGRYVNGKRS